MGPFLPMSSLRAVSFSRDAAVPSSWTSVGYLSTGKASSQQWCSLPNSICHCWRLSHHFLQVYKNVLNLEGELFWRISQHYKGIETQWDAVGPEGRWQNSCLCPREEPASVRISTEKRVHWGETHTGLSTPRSLPSQPSGFVVFISVQREFPRASPFPQQGLALARSSRRHQLWLGLSCPLGKVGVSDGELQSTCSPGSPGCIFIRSLCAPFPIPILIDKRLAKKRGLNIGLRNYILLHFNIPLWSELKCQPLLSALTRSEYLKEASL